MSADETLPIVVVGAAGRMGRMIVSAISADPATRLSGAVDAPNHPDLGKDAGELAGVGNLGVTVGSELSPLLDQAKAVIDFTAPQVTVNTAKTAASKQVPLITGTTGMAEDQKNEIAKLAEKFAVVFAPNMSVGMNLLFHLVKEAARILGSGFDIEVVEAHHRLKKDAPSGTALRLAEMAAEGRGWDLKDAACYAREGIIGERPEKQIGVQTVRGGDIIGDHTVYMAGQGERLEFTHRAHGRQVFAQGAVRAAKWVVGKGPGLYDMQDVLGLKGD